jgi:hypothetical protein
MARRRTEVRQDDVLTREEVKALNDRLSKMSAPGLEAFYRNAYSRCALQPWWLPSPRAIQELVQAWKQLRKSR